MCRPTRSTYLALPLDNMKTGLVSEVAGKPFSETRPNFLLCHGKRSVVAIGDTAQSDLDSDRDQGRSRDSERDNEQIEVVFKGELTVQGHIARDSQKLQALGLGSARGTAARFHTERS